MPKTVLVRELWCYRCGKKGKVEQVHESIPTPRGKLDMPHFKCRSCLNVWYEQADVLAYVFSLSTAPVDEQAAMAQKVQQISQQK